MTYLMKVFDQIKSSPKRVINGSSMPFLLGGGTYISVTTYLKAIKVKIDPIAPTSRNSANGNMEIEQRQQHRNDRVMMVYGGVSPLLAKFGGN